MPTFEGTSCGLAESLRQSQRTPLNGSGTPQLAAAEAMEAAQQRSGELSPCFGCVYLGKEALQLQQDVCLAPLWQ